MLFLLSMGTMLLAACAVGPEYRRPDVPMTATFQTADVIAPNSSGPELTNWWSGFNDPILDTLIERTLANNPDLAEAAARVAEARGAASRAGAALWPTLDGAGSASSVHESLNSPIGRVAHAVGAPRDYKNYAVGAQASWETDLFGSLRRDREAAWAEAQAAEVGEVGARISITAEAADAYLALRGLQAQLELARSQETTQAHLVDLIERRVGQGVSADRELQRAIGELERVRATTPPLRAAIDAELNRLDVLVGAPAGTHRLEFLSTGNQPSPPLPAGSLSPSDLLRRRPDVVIAEHRLAAATARIGIAMAEYYPNVSLGGLLGFASTAGGGLLTSDSLRGEGLAGFHWRLFDFGRVDAEVAMTRGREAEALAAYRGTVLRATEDVETALSRFIESRIEAATLTRQIAALSRARDQAEMAYEGGVLPLIDVLDADRELLQASDRLAIARANEARAAVASFRALGGGWTGKPQRNARERSPARDLPSRCPNEAEVHQDRTVPACAHPLRSDSGGSQSVKARPLGDRQGRAYELTGELP